MELLDLRLCALLELITRTLVSQHVSHVLLDIFVTQSALLLESNVRKGPTALLE